MTISKISIQENDDYSVAVNSIKDAILRSQYQAVKLVNREMLSLYYDIGRYISINSRSGFWGMGAIESISERLRRELPGLRGFSPSSLKNMRMFYEEWKPVLCPDALGFTNSPVVTGDLECDSLSMHKSPVATGGSCNISGEF